MASILVCPLYVMGAIHVSTASFGCKTCDNSAKRLRFLVLTLVGSACTVNSGDPIIPFRKQPVPTSSRSALNECGWVRPNEPSGGWVDASNRGR